MDCLINKEQLTEEVDFLRTNLRLQKHYATLLQDLDKSTSILGRILGKQRLVIIEFVSFVLLLIVCSARTKIFENSQNLCSLQNQGNDTRGKRVRAYCENSYTVSYKPFHPVLFS